MHSYTGETGTRCWLPPDQVHKIHTNIRLSHTSMISDTYTRSHPHTRTPPNPHTLTPPNPSHPHTTQPPIPSHHPTPHTLTLAHHPNPTPSHSHTTQPTPSHTTQPPTPSHSHTLTHLLKVFLSDVHDLFRSLQLYLLGVTSMCPHHDRVDGQRVAAAGGTHWQDPHSCVAVLVDQPHPVRVHCRLL